MQEPVIRKLDRHFVPKVWGVDRLPPQFKAPSGERIGEVWFTPPPQLDALLVKFLFASERLSIQNHPGDADARAMGLGPCGKSECWVIVDAEPGATIAAGFREELDAGTVRSAALDGSIVELLVWHAVSPGDCFFIPAGTVHAVGGGVSLIEVQQNTDITFRLYDYGRPRELHLDQAVGVAVPGPYLASNRGRIDDGRQPLCEGEHFRLAALTSGTRDAIRDWHGAALVIPFSGHAELPGGSLDMGECAFVPEIARLEFAGDATLLVAQAVAQAEAWGEYS
ncbi:MAG: class I mannose-6-phosphate isomerase [Erythrobacter sp.]|jgi:mannose-6-phosphate isomerase